MAAPGRQIIGYDEVAWEVLNGKGRRMPDFATKDFVATMELDRTWSITLIDPDNTEPHSAAVWWVDHCDDDGRQLVRGVMPFRVYCGKRPRAQLYLNQIQRAYQGWVNRGCPVYEAA